MRKQRSYNTRTRKGTKHLRNKYHSGARPAQAADEHETEGHCWVEEAAANAEENPSVDHETESECQRDIEQRTDAWRAVTRVLIRFNCDPGPGKGEEEEEKRSEELADRLPDC